MRMPNDLSVTKTTYTINLVDFDRRGVLNDVIVGDDKAVFADDEAGAIEREIMVTESEGLEPPSPFGRRFSRPVQ
jgi:hypothetical protein